MRRKSPSPELTAIRNESSSTLAMAAIPEGERGGGETAGQMRPAEIKEGCVQMNGEVVKEKGLKRHFKVRLQPSVFVCAVFTFLVYSTALSIVL